MRIGKRVNQRRILDFQHSLICYVRCNCSCTSSRWWASGVTAAILNLALTRVGKDDHSLYDGSWSEWGQFPTLPVATGET